MLGLQVLSNTITSITQVLPSIISIFTQVLPVKSWHEQRSKLHSSQELLHIRRRPGVSCIQQEDWKGFLNHININLLNQSTISKFDAQGEFKQAVEKITGLKITDRESEYLFKVWPWNIKLHLMFLNQWPNINLYLVHQNIFKMVDANHDGIIDAENELNLHKHRTPEYATYAREQTEILLNDQNHA